MLLFARPRRVPLEWLKTQYRLGRTPGFSEAQLAAVRAQVGLRRQHEVFLDQLPSLQIPTLVVWGARDRVFPESQVRDAVARLRDGTLSLIPDCGHMPVGNPERVRWYTLIRRKLTQIRST
jgi:pimeloyl-ACP methyl ester carboxylesterase